MHVSRVHRNPADLSPVARPKRGGFTLVEVMAAVVITALIVLGLSEVVSTTLRAGAISTDRNERIEEARFALERMIRAVEGTDHLLLPRPDDPRSARDEADRDPGVLAMSLPFDVDRDFDGTPDADNDGDGRFNEDPPGDLTGDGLPGIAFVDDDGDGLVDEVQTQIVPGEGLGPVEDDDDEDDFANEDPWNGFDDDGDGWIDEDPKNDVSHDGVAGLPGVDENGDGFADNAAPDDDDEDLLIDEDWLDTVVFQLVGTDLVERVPVPWDVNTSGTLDGLDFLERTLVENISQFRVTRLVQPAGIDPLVEISITLDSLEGDPVALSIRVRAGLNR